MPICVTYVSETCKTERRGMFLSIDLLFIAFGNAIDYILGLFLSWRIAAAVVVILAFSGFLQSFFIPETKYWHLLAGDEKLARKSMLWFDPKLTKPEMDQEIKNIRDSMENAGERKSKIIEFLKCFGQAKYVKSLIVAVILPIIRSCCGVAIVTSYAIEFFEDFHSPYDCKKLSVLYGILETSGCVLNTILFRYCKRKRIFYFYSIIMIITLCSTIGYDWFFKRGGTDPLPWIPIALMLAYVSIACTGFMSCAGVICAETQSAYFRAEAMSLYVLVLNISTATSVYVFPLVQHQISLDYILLFFLINIVIGLLTVVALVSETRDLKFYETGNGENKREPEA